MLLRLSKVQPVFPSNNLPTESPNSTATVSPHELALRFSLVFAGYDKAFGVYNGISQERQDGKILGSDRRTVKDQLTVVHYEAHLAGESGLGIMPIRADNTVMFGAIDIDVYEGLNHVEIAKRLDHLKIPLVVCRSKSGGAHLYCFCKEPIPAARMIAKLKEIAAALGYPNAEIFPKQHTVAWDKDDLGSWLNLPFFNGMLGGRYALDQKGEVLEPDHFIGHAETMRVEPSWFTKPLNAGSEQTAGQRATRGAGSKKTFALPDEIEVDRNNTLTSAAGKWRRDGLNETELLAMLREMNHRRCKPPLPDSEVVTIARSIAKKEPGSVDEDAGLIKALATAITSIEHFARDKGDLLYCWEEGVYRPTGKRVIKRRVLALCDEWGKSKSWTPELAARVYERIQVNAPELWERPPLDTLNCRNGLVDVATRALRPHSPEHLSVVQIPVNFDPQGTCPHIEQFIRDVFPNDTQQLPYEIAAWLMLPDTSIQKAILLSGGGANGKSIWLNLMLNFLGSDNTSSLSLHKIEADRFASARLVGKLCNIGTDLPTAALAGTSVFKALTGGDTITVERKFKESFEFRPFSRLLFSANSLPRSDDSSHGFFRRWLVIPFSRTFNESDPSTLPPPVLNARLTQPGELSGLLNRALDALPIIRKGRFTESVSTSAALDEFRRITDPFAVWLDQNTVEHPNAMVPKDKLRDAYAQVCQELKRPVMLGEQFTDALKRLRPGVELGKSRRVEKGKQTPVYVGLGFKTDKLEPEGLF